MNYLVTGAAGFIGSNIARGLIKLGHQVTTIDNLSTGFESNIPEKCTFVQGCVGNSSISKLKGEKFDAILHIAGQSSGEVSFENPINDIDSNVISTVCLLKYAVKTGCKRFIYAGTMSVYGEQGRKERFSEKDATNPKSFYAVGKLASEHYLKIYQEQYSIKYTVLRYFNVYGEGQNLTNLKQGMISIYLKQFIDDDFEKVEVKGSIERFRDFSHINDIVEVSIETINNSKFYNQIVNIGTGRKIKIKDILRLMRKYLASGKEIIITSGTKGDQFGIYADNRKLEEIYGKKFIKFEDGLKRMIVWVKNVSNNDK